MWQLIDIRNHWTVIVPGQQLKIPPTMLIRPKRVLPVLPESQCGRHLLLWLPLLEASTGAATPAKQEKPSAESERKEIKARAEHQLCFFPPLRAAHIFSSDTSLRSAACLTMHQAQRQVHVNWPSRRWQRSWLRSCRRMDRQL